MPDFNLLEEPWVPCMGRAGPELLGVRETLLRAHEIREIADPSPLVTLALHRLLLAIAHRVYGPKSEDAWKALWERRAWEAEPLEEYLSRWRQRFDLFDDTHPFYQAADLVVTEADLAAYKLVLELSPSNARLFSHTDDANPPALAPAEAARALVAFQCFHAGGLVRKRFGAGPTSGRSGPLAGAAVCLLTGGTLFETLALNMVRYHASAGRPFAVTGEDLPAWEKERPPDDEQRRPAGYLEWLTWQSRSVRLGPEAGEDGTVVRRAVIARGNGLPPGESEQQFEQMVAFRARKDAKPTEEAYVPISLRRDRAVWRDSAALFQSTEDRERPRTLGAVAFHMDEGSLQERATHPLAIYGVAYEQANALFWRSEHLPLPLAYLDDTLLFGKLQSALGLAEGAATAVRFAAQALAAYVLNLNPEGKLDRARREALDRRTAAMAAERRYWAWLEPHFSRFLLDQAETGEGALLAWGEEVVQAARRAYTDVAAGLGTDGDALRVEVEGRGRLERMLAKTRREHPYGEPVREEAS